MFGREIRHSGWYPDYVVRLYRTNYAGYNDSLVHEKVVYPENTKVQKLTGDLEHFTYKSIHHYSVKSAATPKPGQINAKPKVKKRPYGKVSVMPSGALSKCTF